MDKDKMDMALSIARSYYQYHVSVREIMEKMSISKTSVYRILGNFAASNPQIVEEMKQSASPEDLSQENVELKKRLAAMEKELHDAKMAAAAYNKMIDIAERLYKIPVRKKSGPKQ
nr:hypothetical protein [uncultured Prevotella sp.]